MVFFFFDEHAHVPSYPWLPIAVQSSKDQLVYAHVRHMRCRIHGHSVLVWDANMQCRCSKHPQTFQKVAGAWCGACSRCKAVCEHGGCAGVNELSASCASDVRKRLTLGCARVAVLVYHDTCLGKAVLLGSRCRQPTVDPEEDRSVSTLC